MKRWIAVLLSLLILSALFFALQLFQFFSRDLLAGSEERIARYRMGDAELNILDPAGRPIPSALVRVDQISHHFIFGCEIYQLGLIQDPAERKLYLDSWTELFNTGITVLYWRYYEPEPGKYRDREMRELLELFQGREVKFLIHPMLDGNEWGSPAWLKIRPGLEDQIHQHLAKQFAAFQSRVDYWVAVNEATNAWPLNPVGAWIKSLGPVKSTAQALSWARELNPSGTYIVNDYNITRLNDFIFLLCYPSLALRLLYQDRGQPKMKHYGLLQGLEKEKVVPDLIGIETHMHITNLRLWFVEYIINKYRRFGIPLYFSEVSVLSGENRLVADVTATYSEDWWPSTKEGEIAQAEYLEDFYTYVFSRPEVAGVTYWCFSDRYSFISSPCGLLRRDLSPKPAYDRLHRLIREKWHTRMQSRTDSEGKLRLRAFYGKYLVTVQTETGEELSYHFDLSPTGPNSFLFSLPKSGP